MNEKDRAIKALKIIDRYNPIHNDLEAYLNYIALWGMGKGSKPNPKDFGLPEEEKQK